MSDIGWGILATGGIASAFTEDLRTAGLRVAAVGSRTQQAADEFAARHGIPAAHGSWAALASDPAVDIVYVATPHPFHRAAALAVLEAGKHVLVEKPFTLNAPEAREVVQAARDRGLIALEAMWTRWLPHMLEIRDLIGRGGIGEPQVLLVDHTQSISSDPHHRLNDPAQGGGALLDLGIYPVSYGVDLFGVPESAIAAATWTPTGVDQRVSGTLVHANGAHTVFTTASDLRGPNTAAILGTEGRISIDATWYTPTGYAVRDADGAVTLSSRPEVAGRGMQFQAIEAERLIREGVTESERPPADETVAIMGVLDSIRATIGLTYPGERAPGVPDATA